MPVDFPGCLAAAAFARTSSFPPKAVDSSAAHLLKRVLHFLVLLLLGVCRFVFYQRLVAAGSMTKRIGMIPHRSGYSKL